MTSIAVETEICAENAPQGNIALISFHADPSADIGMESAGGQNVYVLEIGKKLSQLGWAVDILTRRNCSKQSNVVYHERNCRTLRLTAGPQKFIPRDRLFPYLEEFTKGVIALQDKRQPYTLIHTNYWLSGWIGMRLKRFQDIKQVHTNHSLASVKYGTIPSQKLPPIANIRLEAEAACLRSVDCMIATSPQEKELLSLASLRKDIEFIPCGTDINRFGRISQIEARILLCLEEKLKVVLYVGRFDPTKGIDILINAIAQSDFYKYPNLRLILIGGSRPGQVDEKEFQRIKNVVQSLGLQNITIFVGNVSHETLSMYYAAADVCVVPSYYESFGLVAIEAMASGTPVVASNTGGLRFTVVNEVTGLLVPPRDTIALSNSIDRILKNLPLAKKLGEAGRERVRQSFSWEKTVNQISNLYVSLLTSK